MTGKVIIGAIVALLLLAPTAAAHTQRLTVDTRERWTTPQRYDRDDVIAIWIRVNGHDLDPTGDRATAWAGRGVIVEARVGTTGPIRFRIANARSRAARVRIVYRRYIA